jgi:hypothetical protein
MKFKNLAWAFLYIATVGCVTAQNTASTKPKWNATIKVIDESGQPVLGAKAQMSWNVNRPDGSTTSDKIEGLTDGSGIFSTSHEANGSTDLGFMATKQGYYPSKTGYGIAQLNDSDPAKWNPQITLLLKKIIRPVPMYAKWVNLGMPVFDKPAGFDLMKGDWIPPYGKGAETDIIFTAHREKRSDDDSDYKLVVGFPNKGDGIQELIPSEFENTSALRSPYEAPADGYQPEWVQTITRRPSQPIQSNRDENRRYIFRVRTILDTDGTVKSALYGKINGDFLQFRYYLNPTPNDRDIEFDPSRNLFSEHNRGGVDMSAP